MEDIMQDNPLGLPRGQNNQAHQLRLKWPEGTDGTRRAALCSPVLTHLATINQGIEQIHQMAAILLTEKAASHTRFECFIQVPVANRQVAHF